MTASEILPVLFDSAKQCIQFMYDMEVFDGINLLEITLGMMIVGIIVDWMVGLRRPPGEAIVIDPEQFRRR